jgi:Fms-interacting protein/Thoc5
VGAVAGRTQPHSNIPFRVSKLTHKLPSTAIEHTEMAVEDLITDPTLRPLLLTSQDTLKQTLEILTWLSETRSNSPSQEAQLNVSRQQKALFSLLAQLRGHNRRAAFGVRTTKQETAEARQEVDRLLLQLQNLYYEQRHLMGEIGGCEGYE